MGCCFTTFCRAALVEQAPNEVSLNTPGVEIIRTLSKGRNRAVYVCQKAGERLVCKMILKSSNSWQKEIDILRFLNTTDFDIKLREVHHTDKEVLIFCDMISGCDLYEYLQDHGVIAENLAKKVFRQLTKKAQKLHRLGIWHLDLKPENIICENFSIDNLALIDFGHAIFSDSTSIPGKGTLGYAAPEQLTNQCSEKTDIWSLGCLLYVILFMEYPVPRQEKYFIQMLEDFDEYSKLRWGDNFSSVSENCQDLINRLLTINPISRPSFREIFDHPWLN